MTTSMEENVHRYLVCAALLLLVVAMMGLGCAHVSAAQAAGDLEGCALANVQPLVSDAEGTVFELLNQQTLTAAQKQQSLNGLEGGAIIDGVKIFFCAAAQLWKQEYGVSTRSAATLVVTLPESGKLALRNYLQAHQVHL